MKRSMWGVLVCLFSVMAVILPGCNNAGGIAVSFVQATTQAIDNGQTFNITATVKNDSSNKGVTWSLTGPGSLTNATTTSVTYNAPAVGAVAHFVTQQAPQTAMVTAKSNADPSKSGTVTITVTPPPSMSNQTLAAGVEGTAYSQQVVETGGAGTLSWQIVAQPGPQPAGLTINSGTGVISGTPTGPNGTFTFTVKVTDSNAGSGGPQSAQAQVAITINLPPAPKITPAGTALPAGTEGTAYSQTFTVSGGLANYTWSVVGSLPAGLTGTQSADTKSFTISGKPTGPNGTTNFQIKVTDSSNPTQSDTQSYSITINLPPPPKISPTGGALPAGTIGTTYTQVFTVNNGLGPTFTWTPPAPGTLPAGLTGAASPGGATFTVTGKPTGPAGPSNFTLKVTDSSNPQQSDTQNYSLQINNPPPPTITTTQAQVPTGTVGTAYNFTFQATGFGTLTFAPSPALTDNLTMDTSGHVTGTPSAKATVSFNLTVTDSLGQSSAPTPFTITINNPPAPVITTTQAQVPSAVVNVAYSFTFQATGFGTLTWSVSPPLTDSLSLNTSTGTISGTPTTQATVSFNLTVTDSLGQSSPATPFTITVSTITIAFTQAPPGSVNTGASFNVSATVSNDPSNAGVDWSVTCGNPGNTNCGSFNPTHTASGATTQYTAPTNVPTGNTVTIVATATAAPKPSVPSSPVTVIQPAFIIIFMQAPPSSLPVNGTTNVSANVSNDPNNKGVDWTVTCGSPGACGSFNPTHTASGATTVYTAPANIPTGNTVTITATTTATPTQNVMATVTITAATTTTCPLPKGGNEALFSGNTFTARFNGWTDNKGPFDAAASFTTGLNADGTGNITSGVVDTNGVGQTPNVNLAMTGGCFSVGADRRGTMIWNFGAGNTVTFAISLRADGHKGKMIEFDDTTGTSGTRGSGEFRKQDTTVFSAATLNGAFAFGIIGWDGGSNRAGAVGVLNFNGVNSITSGTEDFSTHGTSLSNLSFTGSFTAPDPVHGRGTLTLTVTGVPVIGTITETAAYYIEKTGQAFIQTTNAPDTTGGHITANGITVKQSGGPFSVSSFNAPAVFSLTGFDVSHNGTNTSIGMITSTGNGNFTGVIDNNSDSAATNQPISGTITMSSNGLGVVTVNSPAGFNPISVVMGAPNAALLLEGTQTSPGNDVSAGILLPQTVPIGGFTGTSVSGAFFFGSDEPATTGVSVQSGVVTFTSPNLNGAADKSSLSGLQTGGSISGTYTMSANGRGVITSGGTTILWLISTHQALVMDTSQLNGTGNVAIINVEQ